MTGHKKNDPVLGSVSHNDEQRLFEMIRRGASRRDVLKYFMASGATLAASGALFSSATDAIAATPKRGGKLIMAADQHGPNDTLDPALYTSAADYF
ncbi:MAG: hypothetical protein AAFU68_04615, partial [Pseudomonadota bacterium]